MFGYVIANNEILTDDEKARYKNVYCGLCKALKTRHGQLGRLTLTYDMAFLILVLSSLYEPQTCEGCERCFLHPLKRHGCSISEITGYAADMNVALAYLNLLDDWHDDKNFLSLLQAKLLKKKYKRVAALCPRQCQAMERCLSQLSQFERSGEQSPDTGAKLFGELMGEIFVWREDRWSGSLRSMAGSLGEFIYIMDAVVDLEKDIKKRSFNPLIALKEAGRGDGYFEEILTMLIGDCTIAFEKLPLVEDVPIMRSILYSGVWAKYELKKAKKANKAGPKGDMRQ